MKVSELEGAELDYWVAKADGFYLPCEMIKINETWKRHPLVRDQKDGEWIYPWSPSSDWSQGGPIIEREGIDIYCGPEFWESPYSGAEKIMYGPTPLIAAMRAYVASKFGKEVDKNT